MDAALARRPGKPRQGIVGAALGADHLRPHAGRMQRAHELAALDLGRAEIDDVSPSVADRLDDLREVFLPNTHGEHRDWPAGERLEACGERLD